MVYAGFSVPMGWMTGDQMVAVGEVVEQVGGDLRLTRQQDLIVGDVPVGRLGELVKGMAAAGLPIDRNKVYGNSIACTSHRFCNYSVAETKGKLEEILAEFDTRFGEQIADLKVFMDGCPHACAHHWVGDIGLQGTTTTDPVTGLRIEAYDVTLRGGLGPNAAIGRPLLRRVPTGDITATLVRLVAAWLAEKAVLNGHGASYTFRAFCEAHDDETLKAVAAGQRQAGADTGSDTDSGLNAPIVRVPGTLIELTDGVDAVEVAPGTVGQALALIAQRHPRLAAYLLTGPGRVNPAVNLYIDEDDIRSLGGMDAVLERGRELVILPALAGG
jgi:ferredoxin-nitrite reductase